MARTLSYYKISKGDWILIQALGEDGLKVAELCGWKVEKLSGRKENSNEVQTKEKGT